MTCRITGEVHNAGSPRSQVPMPSITDVIVTIRSVLSGKGGLNLRGVVKPLDFFWTRWWWWREEEEVEEDM